MEFRHNQELSRFEAWLDGELVGEAHYVQTGEVADFDHTSVSSQHEGKGIAAGLVSYAMAAIRATDQTTVQPSCPYVEAWFGRHPEYADLLSSTQVS
jgi:uncharacterized protein